MKKKHSSMKDDNIIVSGLTLCQESKFEGRFIAKIPNGILGIEWNQPYSDFKWVVVNFLSQWTENITCSVEYQVLKELNCATIWALKSV